MGIKGLISFLSETAPTALSEVTLEQLAGSTVAIDASTALYQFTVAIREGTHYTNLTNSKGEATSHIAGLMNRCLKLLEAGLKVIFVFDSAPPELKEQTLAKRRELRQEAEQNLEKAIDAEDEEAVKKYMRRTVHISRKENESAKELLRLMGIPIIEAGEEAEAQCAYLVQKGLADSVGTEDADALVFRCGTLLKKLTAGGKKILKVSLEKILELLGLTHDEFIDFCILCGCDYCGTIKGIGPKTAYTLIKKYKCIERILQVKSETLEGFDHAREYFKNPKVTPVDKIVRGDINVEGLKDFLVTQNDFDRNRVQQFIERLVKAKSTKTQVSLRKFFLKPPVIPKLPPAEEKKVEDIPPVAALPQLSSDTPIIKPAEPCRISDKLDIPPIEEATSEDVVKQVKRAYKPTIGLLAVCPDNVKFIKKRHVRC